ncbi:LysR family transcriptional regulator [Pseudoduganella namucuonensis]|uniref:Transcriptional regulator, LysR family n=1 Tax=Pseudoduganella namucuonensis TaxID=1035707 RepID=A0A1I7H1M6_9BURK|nr:LysR family transcriptional regulator [Pseudoduganella namucuonensis]SFU54607.1 transcriptional regulator, LysR family [Pseudoduganella namucuonensis]
MARFDLELLLIFDEIYKTRNVTRAAANLELPQSTVSIGLAKLREHFNDRLFSRTAKGMEPTPRAQGAIGDVRLSIQALQHALADQPVFDPAASRREFRICMTDISEIVLLPQLLNHLKTVGPGIRIDISKISADSPVELADGTVDLAVGFMPHLEAGFYQQKLFDQRFACLVSRRHPRVNDVLDVDALRREGHVVVRTSGTGHAIVDKVLAREGVERNIQLRLPSFLGVARIVAETELIAIVPHRYGVVTAVSEAIRVLPVPVALPAFSVKQHWHERYHADASNRWLRQVMARLFSE